MRKISRTIFAVGAIFILIYFLSITTPKETRTYTTLIKQSRDPRSVYSREITTNEVKIEIDVVKRDLMDYLDNQYDLTVTLHNVAEAQYKYIVNLDNYGKSLIHDSDDVKITYSDHYTAGKNQNERVFVPDEKYIKGSEVGALTYLLRHNSRIVPEMGVVQITVNVIDPHKKNEIATITHQIAFVIE